MTKVAVDQFGDSTAFNAAPARSPGVTEKVLQDISCEVYLQCGPGSLAGDDLAGFTGVRRTTSLQCGPGSLAGDDAARWQQRHWPYNAFNAAPARSPGMT